jgi:hypothetical protein
MQGYPGPRRLDPPADWTASAGAARAIARRDSGVRQTRRISTWTAAALVASVAASAGYFAHAVATPATTMSGTSVSGTAGTGAAGTATGQKASLTHPVVTSGGSGVVASAAGGGAGGGSGGAVHWQDN